MPSPSTSEELCVLALGGNLGDTLRIFRGALNALEHGGFRIRRVSSFLRTKPVDCAPGVPDFLNGAVSGFWTQTPEELLALCQKIEEENGRPNEHGHNTARTLDLDIILFGHEKISTPRLTIPHPRAAERTFVRIPLREIEPELEKFLLDSALRGKSKSAESKG